LKVIAFTYPPEVHLLKAWSPADDTIGRW
jgi:hypothetical protein